jgi:hypothetical protein
MDPIKTFKPLQLLGVLLFSAAACQPQSLPSVATTGTSTALSTLSAAAKLPVIISTSTSTLEPPSRSIFGAELYSIDAAGGLSQMADANMYWVRRNAVVWSGVEPTEGDYDWSTLAWLESELLNATGKGMQVILEVRSTPEWARKYAGSGPSCGPISQNKLAAFGNFMRELVARYSVAPYNVKYWELWNEPDFPYIEFDNIFGCWGDASDAYYGGGYYAEMLKVVYPQIKAADPQGQVLIGGLLMDCDPRPGAGCDTLAKNKGQPMFLEGILRNNGGLYFEGVSFHAYDYYLGKLGQYHNLNWGSAWNSTGPVFIAKAQFIQSLLSQYDVSGKFLVNSETAILCASCDNDPIFETTKASYVAQSYAAAIAQGFRANIWYSVFGWRNSGLLGTESSLLPAYTAFNVSQRQLDEAVYRGAVTSTEIGGISGVMGFKFQNGDRRIWVVWSKDGNPHSITLSSAPQNAWDMLGNSLIPADSMDLDLNPIYLEWIP